MSGAHILHVEDEALIALEVESICRENGAERVTHISDLKEAEQVDLGGFDVALIDLSLRGNSTIALAEQLDRAGVPIIFMSGLERSAIADRFPSAGFVEKPFLASGVVDALTIALTSKPSRSI